MTKSNIDKRNILFDEYRISRHKGSLDPHKSKPAKISQSALSYYVWLHVYTACIARKIGGN